MGRLINTVSHCQRNPQDNAADVAAHFGFLIAHHLVPEAKRAQFAINFKPKSMLHPTQNIKDQEGHLITPSRQPLNEYLQDIFALRESRQQSERNEAQQYGGLGGLIIDGEPGIGKTELVISALINNGFEEMHDFTAAPSSNKPFYRMPVSLSTADKEALLLKAFHEGAVVLIDEINSSPMMERLLNDLLMGKTPNGERPQKPGFMIIGTQNPITMAGRRAASTALSRRLTTVELPAYPDDEITQILRHKGLNQQDAHDVMTSFKKQVAYAKENHLTPLPSFRNVIHLANSILKKGYEKPSPKKWDETAHEKPCSKKWAQSAKVKLTQLRDKHDSLKAVEADEKKNGGKKF